MCAAVGASDTEPGLSRQHDSNSSCENNHPSPEYSCLAEIHKVQKKDLFLVGMFKSIECDDLPTNENEARTIVLQ